VQHPNKHPIATQMSIVDDFGKVADGLMSVNAKQ
jgi:hypothetical protein